MGRIALDYGLAYVAATALLLGLSLALESLLQTDIGNFGTFITLMAASWYAGHRYGRRTGLSPDSGTSWRAAFVMMLVSVLYSVVALGLVVAVMGADILDVIRQTLQSLPGGLLIGIIVIVLAFYLFVPRLFFPIAARRAAKDSITDLTDRF